VSLTSDEEFEREAGLELTRLRDQLDALDLDAEIELAMGILSMEFPDGAKYIINSHRAAKQIWMAAERTAWHFDPRATVWVAAKTGDELYATVASALTKKLGRPVALHPRTS
jgi:CyaY protein